MLNTLKSGTTLTSPLSRKATLTAVVISHWTARRLDRKVTDEVNQLHKATSDAGRYNKLLVDAKHLAKMQKLISRARALHWSMSRPWLDEGPRVTPNTLYMKLVNEFRVIKREYEAEADYFALHFPEYVLERKLKLGDLFRESDYPKPSEIRSKFSMEMTVLPLPDVADFRADLDDDTLDDIKAEMQASTKDVFGDTMKATRDEIVKVVGHMAASLASFGTVKTGATKGSYFQDSLVGNVRDLVELLPAFNFDNDPQLAALIDRMAKELCVEDASVLRENKAVRDGVQKSADEIVKAVEGLFA